MVQIPDDGVIEENLVSAKDDDHKVDHVLEFSISPNSGRISIYYARGKDEASKINFDVNDVIAAETTDRLLAVSSQRRSDQRLEASSIAFNTTGVQDVLGCLKDSDMPDSRSRYEQDLRSFVSVYLTLSEAGKKVLKDAGSPFPPYNLAQRTLSPRLGSEIRSLDRYVGGAKERAVENREAGCPSSGDLAVLDGQACAWCGGDLPTAHQRAGAGYCSQACAEEGRLKRGGKYASGNLRSTVFAVEGGVCTVCRIGAHDLYQQILALHPAERLNKLLTAGWRLPNSAKALENLLQDPKEGDFWQADHIRAVGVGWKICAHFASHVTRVRRKSCVSVYVYRERLPMKMLTMEHRCQAKRNANSWTFDIPSSGAGAANVPPVRPLYWYRQVFQVPSRRAAR